MRWIVYLVVALVLLVMAIVVAGSLLPRKHTASRTVHVGATPERVWQTVVDVAAYPQWQPDVAQVELLPPSGGKRMWRQTDRHHNAITFIADEELPPHRLVTRIADESLPFGGTWTIEIAPAGSGSAVTITENGEVKNPIFRFVARYVMGYYATMDAFLRALQKHLGG